MGAEVLEEDEFQPLFDACKPALSGKKIALFGSYGWGDGEWMRSWEDDCRAAGSGSGLRQRDLSGNAGRGRAGRLRKAGRSAEVRRIDCRDGRSENWAIWR